MFSQEWYSYLAAINWKTETSHLYLLLVLPIVYEGLYLLYQRYISALSRIPGPWWAVSSLPYCRLLSDGTFNSKLVKLHQQYGDVVRVAPNEVSFTGGDAVWDEIYGFRTSSSKTSTFPKDQYWIAKTEHPAMIVADGADHTRYRRVVSHAFSNSALKNQEPIVQGYMTLMVNGMRTEAEKSSDRAIDVVKWFNFLTFDVIADLTFGEAFGCLERGDDQYIRMINNMLHAGAQGRVKRLQPLLGTISILLKLQIVPISALKMIPRFVKFTHDRVQQRLDLPGDRPDFVSEILRHNNVEGKGLTRDELDINCVQFLIAGSETSGTALAGITFLLCRHPVYMEQLKQAVRARFSSQEQITFAATKEIPLLQAVIDEGLRMYPPVPTGFPRLVPKGGATIANHYFPEDTSVYMSQFAANTSVRNFADPTNFRPERWLDDPKYANDKKKIFQPFSYGPRVCIGKHLAYSEIRVALAKILYAFDLELRDPNVNWLDQKVWVTWMKDPLLVKLKPAAV